MPTRTGKTCCGCWSGCPSCGTTCTPSWRSTAPRTSSSVPHAARPPGRPRGPLPSGVLCMQKGHRLRATLRLRQLPTPLAPQCGPVTSAFGKLLPPSLVPTVSGRALASAGVRAPHAPCPSAPGTRTCVTATKPPGPQSGAVSGPHTPGALDPWPVGPRARCRGVQGAGPGPLTA